MRRKKLNFPITVLKCVDWSFWQNMENQMEVGEDEFPLIEGWLCGFLVYEDEEKIVLGMDLFEFEDEPTTTRIAISVPVSTIIWRRDYNDRTKKQ